MLRRIFSVLFLLACTAVCFAQSEPSAIEDNSFLVEEAYNQEANVIQHINTFTRSWDSKDWVYTFTQEWPLPGHEKHQLSYTIPAIHDSGFADSGAGIGDVAFNYRYQLVGGGGKRFSFSPRFTLLIPTGSPRYGRGAGGVGLQTNLPVSIYLNRKIVTHWNAGATFVPSARNEVGEHAFAKGFNFGQSVIWLIHPRFNAMVETIWTGADAVTGEGKTQRNHDLLIGPGVRWAHNFSNGLQVVPGISVPMGVGSGAGEKGIVLYLSFEHPLGRREAK